MCHVLIIEDDWFIADHIEVIARDAGATSVEMADSQRDAVAAAFRQLPEIILSDVNLREGTGPRAVQTIMAEFGPIPVIFITATPGDCVPCEPPAIVLTKPITSRVLTEMFKQLAPLA